MDLIIKDSEEGMQKGLINNQYAGVPACARQIILLAELASDSSHNNRVQKSSICSIFSFTNPKLIHSCEGIGIFFL